MRAAVNVVVVWSAIALLQMLPSVGAAGEREAPPGSARWVPSIAVTSGVFFQGESGAHASYLLDATGDPSTASPLRRAQSRSDRVVSPYVGGNVELMTPSLRMFAFPRLFVSAEVLPSFSSERVLALDGEPTRIRGPEVNTVLAVEEDSRHYQTQGTGAFSPRQQGFEENDANGQGMKTIAQIDQIAFGAKVGAAFAFELRGRQLRLKPSLGWLHYKVNVKGRMVDPSCLPSIDPLGQPTTNCTNVYTPDGTGGYAIATPGFVRESILIGHDSGVFDGIGPGFDLEMDTTRVGPMGVSIFAGIHAYYIMGDRDIVFATSRAYSDPLGNAVNAAVWRTTVQPWMYRAGLGVRFQWLGNSD
jgi:hypothetical protein